MDRLHRRLFLLLGAIALLSAGCRSGAADLPDPAIDAPLAKSAGEQTAVVAGGCFWGVQAVFEHVRGVKAAVAGYSGGSAAQANYAAVSGGNTGHAESVKIVYDPATISYGKLLKIFFSVAHDPTELDRQGPDVGKQYRSAVFFADGQQRQIAAAYVSELERAKVFASPIVTHVDTLSGFYPAEDYHQHYVARHPGDLYVVVNDLPKLAQLQSKFPSLYRSPHAD